jgi:hypothetical protein
MWGITTTYETRLKIDNMMQKRTLIVFTVEMDLLVESLKMKRTLG